MDLSNPPCKLPTWTAHDLEWHNSSSHLDCTIRIPRENTSSTSPPSNSGINGSSSTRVNPLCYTGLSRQPEGYGPPETFTVTIDDIGPCRQSNPGSVPPRHIGNSYIRCGSSAPTLYFQGSSNAARSTGVFRVMQQFACSEPVGTTAGPSQLGISPGGGSRVKIYTAFGEKRFDLVCEHDERFNATCRSEPARFEIPVKGWRPSSLGPGRMVLDLWEEEFGL